MARKYKRDSRGRFAGSGGGSGGGGSGAKISAKKVTRRARAKIAIKKVGSLAAAAAKNPEVQAATLSIALSVAMPAAAHAVVRQHENINARNAAFMSASRAGRAADTYGLRGGAASAARAKRSITGVQKVTSMGHGKRLKRGL